MEFEWDKGNKDKNLISHKVTTAEAEQVYLNNPIYVEGEKENYKREEDRFYAYGTTDAGRKLIIVFAKRNRKIRVISARDMSRKERKWYEHHN